MNISNVCLPNKIFSEQFFTLQDNGTFSDPDSSLYLTVSLMTQFETVFSTLGINLGQNGTA